MVRDVELPHAEREVDRVQIFERRWQHGQVRRERDDREQTDDYARQVRRGGGAGRR